MRRVIKIAAILTSGTSFAQSHNLVNNMRSGAVNHLFVSQSTALEAGVASGDANVKFQGAGISTSTGVEIMKFVQASAGHSFLSLRNKEDSHERLIGSRFNATLGLVFGSPVVNLEFGGGFVGGKYDYINQDLSGEIYTRGGSYFLGVNYFLSSQISFLLRAVSSSENAVDIQGVDFDKFKYDSSSALIGFSIWLYR